MANEKETDTVTTNLRIPKELHANVTKAAKRERRSLNAQILLYMEQGAARDGFPLDHSGEPSDEKAEG